MINLFYNSSFLNSFTNSNALPTNLMHFKITPSPLTLSNETVIDCYDTVKKIKQEGCYYRTFNNRGLEMKEGARRPVQQQKVLFVKNHCYNLTGFSNNSCNNIKVVTGKRKHPEFDRGTFDQYSCPQSSINTLSEGNFSVNNHTLEVKAPVNRMIFNRALSPMNHQVSKVRPEPYQNMISYKSLAPFHGSQQMTKPKIAIHQTLQPYVSQKRLNKQVKPFQQNVCKKPLSKTAQTFIQQKAIKNQEVTEKSQRDNNVTEIKAKDLTKVNATLEFSYSTFNIKIKPKRRNYIKIEDL